MPTLQSLNYQSNVLTNRIKQGSQFDVSLLYFEGVSFVEVQEGLNVYIEFYFTLDYRITSG